MRRPLVFLAALVTLLAFAGGAQGAARLYMPGYGVAEPEPIGGFERSNSLLTALAGSPFKAYAAPAGHPAGIVGLAFTPDGNRAVADFLFAGGLQGYSVTGAGALTLANPQTTHQSEGMAVSPDGRFVYQATRESGGTEGINVFSIGADGTLTRSGPAYDTSESFGEIALTPNGRFAFANTFGNIHRYAVNPDGSLTLLGSTLIGGTRWMTVSPDGRNLFFGLEGGVGGVVSYAIGADGSLTANGPIAPTGSSGIKPFAVAPDGSHLYMPDSNTDTITVVAVAANGTLSVVGSTPASDVEAVAVSPDGRFLYWYHGGSPTGIGVDVISSIGLLTPLNSEVAWKTGEPVRLVFQPGPPPVAKLTAKPNVPGQPADLNASASTGAAHYDWSFGDGSTLADGGPKPQHSYAKAGTYTVRVSETDDQGCGAAQIYTGQSTTCPGGSATTETATVDTLPLLSGLKLTKKRFAPVAKTPARKKAKAGTVFLYTLSEKASVSIKIERKLPGRRVGSRCRKPTKGNQGKKKCPRFRLLGSVPAKGKAGKNRTSFNGKLKHKPLAAGPYRARAIATDSANGRSPAQTAPFTILGS